MKADDIPDSKISKLDEQCEIDPKRADKLNKRVNANTDKKAGVDKWKNMPGKQGKNARTAADMYQKRIDKDLAELADIGNKRLNQYVKNSTKHVDDVIVPFATGVPSSIWGVCTDSDIAWGNC